MFGERVLWILNTWNILLSVPLICAFEKCFKSHNINIGLKLCNKELLDYKLEWICQKVP